MPHTSWNPLFEQYEFDLDEICKSNVFPPRHQIFRVFDIPVDKIRIVLLGQDPYHKRGQAHGLSFSVPKGIPIPPSLRNMFKAIKEDFPEREYMFHSGNLEAWFEREGIFLLNASLTVDEGKPSSHIEMWREFTNDVIRFIDNHNKKCVYLLLGKFAQSKAHLIQNGQMIYGIHPSPLAVNQGGFFDAHLFRKVESILGETINWSTE